MFAKLKKKIADEAATAPRPGGLARMPRSISKESVTSAGADSGDDFPSDGSSSREDLSSQLFRRNEHIRKLEVKLSDYAEQVRNLQKIKEKLENALETHQDSFVKKLQEQNEMHQASVAKMAEGMSLALEKKDQEWREKLSHLEKERKLLSAQLQEMREQSLNLFQKRDEIDELEGFQQQELAKIKHMLLKKEESLARMEGEMRSSTQELLQTRDELQASRDLSTRLTTEVQGLQQQQKDLMMERDELQNARASAENKITSLEERSQDLQSYVQRVSVDLQKAQLAASSAEKSLHLLQGEHKSLKLEFQEQRQKMAVQVEEKSQLVGQLQEKVATLEKQLEGSLSGDEHFQQLFREKSALEQSLEDTRQELLTAQTGHKESLNLLETQIDQLNGRLATEEAGLRAKEESLRSLQASASRQQQDWEQALQLAKEALAKSQDELREKESQLQKLQVDLESERAKSREDLSSMQSQWTDQVKQLEKQVSALESAQTLEREAAQRESGRLEKENAKLKDICGDLENSLRQQVSELERVKAQLSSHTEVIQTLEETWKQSESLQEQVADLTLSLQEKEQQMAAKTDSLLKREEEAKSLRQGHDLLLLQMHQLQSSLDSCKGQAAEREAALQEQLRVLQMQLQEQQERLLASEKQGQAAVLELASMALEDHLHLSEDGEAEPNGELVSSDAVRLQKENRDLEQQIVEKNKMIKQLQQRMAELKKTLQKELKIRPDGEVPEAPTAGLTVTNNCDLSDSREVNFEYLKHVVLKFMSCRESEALHLIKALSVLLSFSPEEENMVKETLEYKMSWFGSKPLPRGTVRPSISNPGTMWS
ncbi:golgin subfamily A member 1 isoform X1 [Crotalus tigris]|uniref:golgin subfamily A member 1 isoform X1 n=1 Tax=Crotalus tigris TaxID=88082 RepID=UPI00192F8A9A|nr:golgin subfamily A member 1 isoform X1 [Crotalus tigris]XP_039178936.1 golgin subfamily A member 1 isoform X1 [Crotalus tigris]XP_039178937.1 golgin subfamily A member 1 isoform X1 [Crotalus tigris]